MKKIINSIVFTTKVLLLAWCFVGFPILMASCSPKGDSRERKPEKSEVRLVYKHKVGDIVYLKPDSLRAVIDGLYSTNSELLFKNSDGVYPVYSLYYFMKDGTKVTERFREELIY